MLRRDLTPCCIMPMVRVVHGASCPWGELSMGRAVHGASCPWRKLSMGGTVHGGNCPWGELSMGRAVHGASCAWRELSMGRAVIGQVVMGRVVMGRFWWGKFWWGEFWWGELSGKRFCNVPFLNVLWCNVLLRNILLCNMPFCSVLLCIRIGSEGAPVGEICPELCSSIGPLRKSYCRVRVPNWGPDNPALCMARDCKLIGVPTSTAPNCRPQCTGSSPAFGWSETAVKLSKRGGGSRGAPRPDFWRHIVKMYVRTSFLDNVCEVQDKDR